MCVCVQKRHVLEQTEQLEPRVSALDEDLEADEEDEEEEEEEEDEEAAKVSVCPTHLTFSSIYLLHSYLSVCIYQGRGCYLSHPPPPSWAPRLSLSLSLYSSVSPASQTFPQSPQRS